MSDGISNLEAKIARFEELIEEMREVTSEAHSTLKSMRKEREASERYLLTEGKKIINDRVVEAVKTELDKIGPEMRQQTSLIYEKVGKEIDKLIDICLGKEFSRAHGREDLRPKLAAKLKQFLREVINEELIQ